MKAINNIKWEGVICTLFFLICSGSLSAQFYSSGQEPASLRWKELKTKDIRVIFPQGQQSRAYQLAALLQNNVSASSFGLKARLKPIPVWLHAHSVYANGMVAWAPDRMEIYSVPPQDSYSQQWLPQLAVHEYRHVVQLHALNEGFSRGMSYLFGQQATGAVLGLYIPMWFMEGDAVANETALTKSGRGRQPAFEKYLRAQLSEKGSYSYAKATFGSYRDFVPDRYRLGYYLVANAYVQYGSDFWAGVVQNVARKPWQITPFSRGIKNGSGLNKWQWYQKSMQQITARFRDTIGSENDNPALHQEFRADFYTNIVHVTKKSNGHTLALIRGKEDVDYLAEIDEKGQARKIFEPGYYLREDVFLAEDVFLYAESAPDLRWANRSFTRIAALNVENGQKNYLTEKGRWFSPVLSDDRQKLAAIRINMSGESLLSIKKLKEQSAFTEIPAPADVQIAMPEFSRDGKRVFVFGVSKDGKGILACDVRTGVWQLVLPYGKYNLNHMHVSGDSLFFTASFSGVDQIYALALRNKEIYQLTNEEFAADYASLHADTLLYSAYTANGFRMARLPLQQALWKKAQPLPAVFPLAEEMAQQRPEHFANDTVLHGEYSIKPYRKAMHLFDFHSWGPVSVNAGTYEVKPGFSVQSQNLLSTSFFSVGYEYDINDESGIWFADYTYKGWYPQISLRSEYSQRSQKLQSDNHIYDYVWNQYSLESKVAVPFNLSQGSFSRLLQLEAGYDYTLFDDAASTEIELGRQEYNIVDGRLYYSNIRQTSEMYMYPRSGQIIDLNFRSLPFEEGVGRILSAEAVLYFPSFIRFHGLRLYGGWQKRAGNGSVFSSIVNYPRGYSGQYNQNLLSFQSTYRFPLLYPDFSMNGFLYLKRLKAAVFYDYAKGKTDGFEQSYQSVGAELSADFHLFEMIAPLDAGIRSIYLPNENDWRFELMFRIDFVSLY